MSGFHEPPPKPPKRNLEKEEFFSRQAQELTLQQVEEYRAAFDHFDKDSDGKILAKELKQILANLDPMSKTVEIRVKGLGIDIKDCEYVDFELFLKIVAHRLKDTDCPDEIRDVFREFDKDGDGTISARELRTVLISQGEKLTEEEVDSLVSQVDQDARGRIDYEEFVKAMIRRCVPFRRR